MPKWLRELWLYVADAFDELLLFPTSQERRNVLICEAITARRPVAFDYRGNRCIVEPYCLGLVCRGPRRNESLLCYQTGGDSELTGEAGWKLYRAMDIRDVAAGAGEFSGDRPDYDPAQLPMYRVYCRVVPADRPAGLAAESIGEPAPGTGDRTAREQGPLSHNDLMARLRRRHPPAVLDLNDLGELPENEEPAPRSVTPAPDNPPENS